METKANPDLPRQIDPWLSTNVDKVEMVEMENKDIVDDVDLFYKKLAIQP